MIATMRNKYHAKPSLGHLRPQTTKPATFALVLTMFAAAIVVGAVLAVVR